MKCIIPGNHVKVFGRAVHSLSKIGDELYIESLDNGLALRTVNSSRSAYACFLFNPSFFHEYNDGRPNSPQGSEEDTTKCKIAMKSCLSVFRSLSSLEKTVDRCRLTLNVEDARLVFQLYCRHGIVKTHNLAFIECETLQAVFSPEATTNHLTAQSRLLCDVVANFQNNQEEVTLTVSADRVSFKNYCEDVADPGKMMHTALSLAADEFDLYKVDTDADVTFCLKELRALLAFSEANNLPLSLHFDTCGKPIIFSMDGDNLFEASLVLATLAEPANDDSSQAPRVKDHHTSHNTGKPRTVKKTNSSLQPKRHDQGDDTTVDIRSDTTFMDRHNANDTRASLRRCSPERNNSRTNPRNVISSSDPRSGPVRDNPVTATTTTDRTSSSESPPSPVFPAIADHLQNTSRVENICVDDKEDDENDEMNDTIPGTPPSKKFKSLFFGASQATITTQQRSQPESEVLAENTDDED